MKNLHLKNKFNTPFEILYVSTFLCITFLAACLFETIEEIYLENQDDQFYVMVFVVCTLSFY